MNQRPDCSIVLSVERGKLESQAVLLVDSLRRFGGRYAESPVYAISPRPARQMGRECREALRGLGVEIVVESLVSEEESYGTVARLGSCVWAENQLRSEVLISLDDDLFFAREPDFELRDTDMLARPVDVKGMCTSGSADPFDVYWRRIAEVCGVNFEEIPWLETTVDKVRVKASYNGGMVAVRRERGLFREAQRMFQDLRSHDLSPRQLGGEQVFASTGFVGPEASRWWGSAQAVLSLAATRLKLRTAIAPRTYNVPVHLAEVWAKHGVEITLKDAVLVHYHWLLGEGHCNGEVILPGAGELPEAVFAWLRQKTPLAEQLP